MDTDSTNNKRSPEYNVPKKSVPLHQMKKPRKYFDSADYFLNHQNAQHTDPAEMMLFDNDDNVIVVEQIPAGSDFQHMYPMNKKPFKSIVPIKGERKFFDSADWILMGEVPLPTQHYRSSATVDPVEEARKTVAKKKVTKTRKYFDSADWAQAAAEKNSYVPQMYPKLDLLKS